MEKKRRILVVGDYNVFTGFSNVNTNIFEGLKNDFDISVVASNYNGFRPNWPAHFPVFATQSVYGVKEIVPAIQEFNPDIIYTLNDGFVTPYFAKQILSLKDKAPAWVAHVVFDGLPIRDTWADFLRYAAKIVFPTDWQKQEFAKKYPFESEVIYHGVDNKKYFPMSDEDTNGEKKKFFGTDNIFIFGMVAKNFQRKRYPELLQAFKLFKQSGADKDKPAILLLHADIANSQEQFHLKNIVEQIKLPETCISTTPAMAIMQDEDMNVLYNLFDVNCLISIGEGYGLPTNHACATGKPTIACNNSVQPDLASKSGCMFLSQENDFETYITLDDSYSRRLPNINALAETLKKVYLEVINCDRKKELKQKALNFAQFLDWKKNIIPQWKKLFNAVPIGKQRKVIGL